VEYCGTVFPEKPVIVILSNVSRCTSNVVENIFSVVTALFPYYKSLTLPAVLLVFISRFLINGKGKGQATPLQALTGPEVSRWLRLPDFKTIGK
jgi:hypothetical protein